MQLVFPFRQVAFPFPLFVFNTCRAPLVDGRNTRTEIYKRHGREINSPGHDIGAVHQLSCTVDVRCATVAHEFSCAFRNYNLSRLKCNLLLRGWQDKGKSIGEFMGVGDKVKDKRS